MMATNYAGDKLTTAIKNHLAEICLTELKRVGLRGETVENLFAPAALQAKARGIE